VATQKILHADVMQKTHYKRPSIPIDLCLKRWQYRITYCSWMMYMLAFEVCHVVWLSMDT